MRAFGDLLLALDRTQGLPEKQVWLEHYLRQTPAVDAVWALWFLLGRGGKRVVKSSQLRQWAAEAADLPVWLVEESQATVGDLAETISLILPQGPEPTQLSLAQWVEEHLLPLPTATPPRQRELIQNAWSGLENHQRYFWNQLITGRFRSDLPPAVVIEVLARHAGVVPAVMAHRLHGNWQPTATDLARILSAGAATGKDPAQPYPFHQASPLDGDARRLGAVNAWQVEWKWNGVRAQILRREKQTVIWSHQEEILTRSFPEIAAAAAGLPDGTVLEGEILCWRGDRPLPVAELQRRRRRATPDAALHTDALVVFMAFDLLELGGADCRLQPLRRRRAELETLISQTVGADRDSPPGLAIRDWRQGDLFDSSEPAANPVVETVFRISPALSAASWEEVEVLQSRAREFGSDGLMLKQLDSAYGSGREPGAWWKWKVKPLTCDAILVAAQPGADPRATVFSQYTFAVWQGDVLVPVTKADSGLTDLEIDEVDAFVKANTTGRYGPVRSVKPERVFEIAFDGLAVSTRHKCGLTLRNPRMVGWRRDQPPAAADTLETLRRLAQVPTLEPGS